MVGVGNGARVQETLVSLRRLASMVVPGRGEVGERVELAWHGWTSLPGLSVGTLPFFL